MRWRFAVCTILAAAGSLTFSYGPADLRSFALWGQMVLDGRWSSVYDSSFDQAGPLQLLISRALMVDASGARPLPLVVALVNVSAVFAVMQACQRSGWIDPGDRSRRQLLVGVLAALWTTQGGLWSGHPAEGAIPLLWFAGLYFARARRWAVAAVCLGLAGAIAPWAVLALPALLAVLPIGRALVAAVASVAVCAACYLPFIASGHFAMFDHVWPVTPGSGPSAILNVHTFDWTERLGQAALVAGCTAIAAIALRPRAELSVALVPLCTALLRIVSDPLTFDYYWTSVGVLTLIALAIAPPVRTFATAEFRQILAPYLAWLAVAVEHKLAGAIALLGIALSYCWRGRRPLNDWKTNVTQNKASTTT